MPGLATSTTPVPATRADTHAGRSLSTCPQQRCGSRPCTCDTEDPAQQRNAWPSNRDPVALNTPRDTRRLEGSGGHRVDFAGIAPTGPTPRSGHPLPFLGEIQQSFGRYDVSRARAITGNAGAAEGRRLGAEAFTRGLDVTFASRPSLRTAAHEAAHVIQQLSGSEQIGNQHADADERQAETVAGRVERGHSSEDLLGANPAGGRRPWSGIDSSGPRTGASVRSVVQMRRIPPNVRALLTASAGGNGPNFAANAEGVQRLIDAALGELTAAEQARVRTRRLGGLTDVQFNALSPRQQRVRGAEAIVAEFSGLRVRRSEPNRYRSPRAHFGRSESHEGGWQRRQDFQRHRHWRPRRVADPGLRGRQRGRGEGEICQGTDGDEQSARPGSDRDGPLRILRRGLAWRLDRPARHTVTEDPGREERHRQSGCE